MLRGHTRPLLLQCHLCCEQYQAAGCTPGPSRKNSRSCGRQKGVIFGCECRNRNNASQLVQADAIQITHIRHKGRLPDVGNPPARTKVSALVFCSPEIMNHLRTHRTCVAKTVHTRRHCQTHHHHHCQSLLQNHAQKDIDCQVKQRYSSPYDTPTENQKRKELLPACLSAGQLHSRFGVHESVRLVITYHCQATSCTLEVAPPLPQRP